MYSSNIYSFLSSLFSYLFTTIIYLFILSIIHLIYTDIRHMYGKQDKGGSEAKGKKSDRPVLLTIKTGRKTDFKLKDRYSLSRKDVIIGRDSKCDIQISDKYLSSEQVQIWQQDGQWYITDLGSKNGTFLNEQKISNETFELDEDDIISLGRVKFKFCYQ